MNDDEDKDLVSRARVGDRAALDMLVSKYQRPIFNVAYRIVGNSEDAADLTQSVFLKAFEKLGDFDEQYRFFSWIYRIAVNESLNLLRTAGRMSDAEIDLEAPDSANPEAQASSDETDQRVQRALMRMKPEDRVILTMRHISECSYRDIAGILQLSEKKVKSRLYSARLRLRDLLETWYVSQ